MNTCHQSYIALNGISIPLSIHLTIEWYENNNIQHSMELYKDYTIYHHHSNTVLNIKREK